MQSEPLAAPSRKWWVLATIALVVFMAMIDSSIVNLALPTFAHTFDVGFAAVQWIVLSYMLTVTTLMISAGRAADIVGKRPLLVGGISLFTAASAFCAIDVSIPWLLAWRVVQGAGAAVIMALAPAILVEVFPPAERGRAIGTIGSAVSAGVVLGPTVGGFILGHLGWSWIFLVNLPLGLLAVVMTLRSLPPPVPATTRQRFDVPGALAMGVALVCILLALTFVQPLGFGHPVVAVLVVGGLTATAVFLKVETGAEQPIVELSLFRNALFCTNLVSSFLSFIATAGTLLLMPFFLQNVLHYGTERTGLLMAVMPVIMGVVAPIAGGLSDRFGVRPITCGGLSLLLLGFLAVSGLSEASGELDYILRFIPVGLGLGLFQAPNNSAIMGAVPRERLGIAGGLLAVARTLGQTTGIAVLGTVWSLRVSAHGGTATEAPLAAQVGAFQDTALVIAALIAAALVLTLYGTRQVRKPSPVGT